MSQFLIISGKGIPKINIKKVKLSQLNIFPLLMLDVAKHYHFPIRRTWVVTDETSDSIDILLLDANYQIASGLKLSDTRLGNLLGILVIAKCHFLIWPDDEYSSLKNIDNPIFLVDMVYQHLQQGQLYINYKKKSEVVYLWPK